MKIRIAFMGRSYLLAGHLPDQLEVPDSSQLADALELLAQRLGDDQQLPPSCLVTLCGKHLGTLAAHANCPLTDGDELVLIAPVAGG